MHENDALTAFLQLIRQFDVFELQTIHSIPPADPLHEIYLGITVPNFPNLFCLYGPGTNLAHGGSLFFQSECQVHYVMDALRLLLSGPHRTMEPRPEIHDEYRRRYEQEISQMVWSHWSVKHSPFKNPDGRIFTLSPWPNPTSWSWPSRVDPGDYVLA